MDRWRLFLMFVVRVVLRVVYRVRVRGLEALPAHGAAMVVANHVSFLDALLLGSVSPRPIRFVMDHAFVKMPGAGWFFRAHRVIVIAPERESPALFEQGFIDIDAALAAGEVVCIFPEGGLTKDGEVARFRPGVRRVLDARAVPVVPVGLRGLWGSAFSRDKSWRWVRILRRRSIGVVGGAALSPQTPLVEMRDVVLGLCEG